ncbi:lipoate--protein ligase [Defluviitalea phaphyphila]|uniref:lipoate--protein ligase n=1 Tax=Defluviitalea phaphyphila TaxID=1473580 RepID=UPI000A898143|nr:lipoate--protein ligase [Defluviitalea phaphyphila]
MLNVEKTVYISQTFDPVFNLSAEEYLMSICNKNEIIMYLWQNEKTIVIGKHQNPYKECDVYKIAKDKVNLVRRSSGGGAVFQDLGNLNFTFIAHKNNYDEDKNFKIVIAALKEWNITAHKTGRNDLTVDNKKISGNAFMHNENISCHHGTLLINVNLYDLTKYLTPSKIKLKSKGVESVSSRVANLKDFNEDINSKSLKKSLIKSFDKNYLGILKYKKMPSYDELKNYLDKYTRWEWNFAESPKANISKEVSFDWGNFRIDFNIHNGEIKDCTISTDTLLDEPFLDLEKAIIGKKFKVNEIIPVIQQKFTLEKVKNDLTKLIKNIVVK